MTLPFCAFTFIYAEIKSNSGEKRLRAPWGQWLTKVGIIIGIVVVMFLLLFCCVVPFIRSMLASAAAKQMINVSVRPTGIDVGCTNMYTVGPGLDELDDFV